MSGAPPPEVRRARRAASRRAGREGLRGGRRAPRRARRGRVDRASTVPTAGGTSSRAPRRRAAAGAVRAPATSRSVLGEPATDDVSVHWVVEGWPEDVERAIASFRAHEGGRRVRYVVADVTGADPGTFGDDVEVISLEHGTPAGGPRCNAGLRRATGRVVLVVDGSIEVAGDVFGPLERRARAIPTSASSGRSGSSRTTSASSSEAPGPGALRRDRGLLHGDAPRCARRGRRLRREVPLVPHGRHRAVVPGEGPWAAHRGRAAARSSSTSTACGSRPIRPNARSGRSGTSTGSSTGGAAGGTSCWTLARRTSGA